VAVAGDDVYRWGGSIFTSSDSRDYDAVATNELQRFEGGAWITLETRNDPGAAWHRGRLFFDAKRGELVRVGGWEGGVTVETGTYRFPVDAIRIR
jgi:hypothetical protein